MSSQPPHYQRVAEVLLGQIAAGAYSLGDRLPTETDLSEQFGLARETIRRGLDRLEQLGMIERRAGKGTKVVSIAPVGSYPTFATSAKDIKSLATATRLRHPKSAEVTVDAALARRIGTRAGSRWFVLEGPRVRRESPDQPICWSEHYLRANLPREALVTGKFDVEDVASVTVEQTVTAAFLDPRIAKELDAESGSPALVIIRRHLDKRRKIISVGYHTHPADRYQIVTVLPGSLAYDTAQET
jgi:GntR family transcriptional regulator